MIWRVVKNARCAGEDPDENCGGELEFLRERDKREVLDVFTGGNISEIGTYPREEERVSRKDEEPDNDFPEHSLFPYPDDEDGFDVSFIQVTRWEQGKHVWGPVLAASEIPDELALIDMFGGGQYVLIARQPQKRDKSKPGNETRRRKITLPGRSKPFSSDPTVEEEAEATHGPRPAPAPQASGMVGGGGFEQVLLAMMNMQQQTAERAAAENRESARREAENSKAFMTMFLGMMNASKSDSAQMMQMMMTLSSQQQQSMIQLLPAIMGARGGGPEEMAKFADLFKTLGFTPPATGKATSKDDDNSIGAILANGADVVQGILAIKGGFGGAPTPGPVNVESSPPALPGSAAEMLERMKRGG